MNRFYEGIIKQSSVLAPYASHPGKSRGRWYPEQDCRTRTPFRRDCDRIIHCTAFRRLEYKTQVFVNHEGDHYRTRLTHSLEVAQITRGICRNLGLEEDLGETLALAHDLGHPPFGHAGEDALNKVMQPYGGFSHNLQTIKILTRLEQRYALFDGLNLTWETLEGLIKHNGPLTGAYRDMKRYKEGNVPSLLAVLQDEKGLALDAFPGIEAQVASLADDIAYHNHDIDDGLRAGLFSLDAISELPWVGGFFKEVRARYPDITQGKIIHESIRRMIHHMVMDVLATTQAGLKEYHIETDADIRAMDKAIIRFSAPMQAHQEILRQFLMGHMYRHDKLVHMTTKAKQLVEELFYAFFEDISLLPEEWQQAVKGKEEKVRAEYMGDYIAGMTDRYAIQEYERVYDKKIIM